MAKNRYLPFGYMIRNGEIVINEQEAALVRTAFEKYMTGASYAAVAETLQATGIRYHSESFGYAFVEQAHGQEDAGKQPVCRNRRLSPHNRANLVRQRCFAAREQEHRDQAPQTCWANENTPR